MAEVDNPVSCYIVAGDRWGTADRDTERGRVPGRNRFVDTSLLISGFCQKMAVPRRLTARVHGEWIKAVISTPRIQCFQEPDRLLVNVITACTTESTKNMAEETPESRLSKNVVIAYDGSEHAKNAVKCEYFLKHFINRTHA